MKVELNLERTQDLRDRIWKSRSLWGKEPHRSDAVYCLVKAYCRMTGVQPLPREKVVENWITGEVIHRIVQDAFPKEDTEVLQIYEDIEVLGNNPQVHFDIMWDETIMELKSTTLSILVSEDIPHEYLDQIRYGLIFNGKKEAQLVTFDIVNKVLLVWNVAFSEKELKEARVEYQRIMKLLSIAVESKNYSFLEPKYNECRGCPYNYRNGCPYIG